MNKPNIVNVTCCKNCPFFTKNLATFLVNVFKKTATEPGMCTHDALGKPFPVGSFFVQDDSTIPDRCPLRVAPTHIALATDGR